MRYALFNVLCALSGQFFPGATVHIPATGHEIFTFPDIGSIKALDNKLFQSFTAAEPVFEMTPVIMTAAIISPKIAAAKNKGVKRVKLTECISVEAVG